MIRTILRSHWLHTRRDTVVLGLTFVLPIIFFTIFAIIFGSMGGGGDGIDPLRVIVVDADSTGVSARFAAALEEQDALRVYRAPRPTDEQPEPPPYDREGALAAVRRGHVSAAVILPEGFGDDFGNFTAQGEEVEVIYDAANPLAQHVVSGLLQAAAFRAAPDVLMEQGMGYLDQFGGGLTSEQQAAIDQILPFLRGERDWEELAAESDTPGASDASGGGAVFEGLVRIRSTDARAAGEIEEERRSAIVSYYAAGIGVLFVLFSMAGAGGSLLEEEESGTLERVLVTNTSMTTLLLGKWIFFGLMALLQLVLMFLWGALVFGLDLFTSNHLAGFLVMSVVTAAAASGFGIVLAALCRSRAQLSGISTVVILVMGALGGSMVPGFVMPDFMDTAALFTFNGWALDGYLKVFWYDDPNATVLQSVGALLPQLAVLAGLAAIFFFGARLLARRWETV
ncbi:MAG: ABC transporter permease subunit [Candidatus Eisenbacteria bacterium]|nr:ABC transporter permease subunit [Candidatus Eisenbacteria bacterium]